MSIFVVCPGCRKRFQVSDQFAGRTGPCPSCKTQLQIPKKGDEVKVHTPEQFGTGGRSAVTGQLVLKPIARSDVKFRPAVAAAVATAVIVVFVAAFVGRSVLWEHFAARIVGLLALSPPLVMAGYWFLQNDELEPYRGKSLYFRSLILALVYAALWGLFALPSVQELIGQFTSDGAVWIWLLVRLSFLMIGGLAALGCLDLEFGNALIHYGFYVLVTVVLGWTAGMGWPWQHLTS